MVNRNDDKKKELLESRPPTLEDLVSLCKNLNTQGAKYIVIGGMAIIQQGFVRATEDIDLLVDVSQENQEKIKSALSYLPDKAVLEVRPEDLNKYVVVRIADEIVIDLMKSACGVEYLEAQKDIVLVNIEGIEIPFANPQLLFKLKQSVREKDSLDRLFLERLLGNKG